MNDFEGLSCRAIFIYRVEFTARISDWNIWNSSVVIRNYSTSRLRVSVGLSTYINLNFKFISIVLNTILVTKISQFTISYIL